MKHTTVEFGNVGCAAGIDCRRAAWPARKLPPLHRRRLRQRAGPAAPRRRPSATPDQTSYLFGLTFGEQMHRVGITDQLSVDAITRGMKDGLQGRKTTPAEQQQLQAYVRSAMESAIAHNQAAAKEFLARNAQEKGVTTTASGLQYKILAPGDRKAPPRSLPPTK